MIRAKQSFSLILTALATALAISLPLRADAMANASPPQAVTLWWVIFNAPEACTANPGGVEQCGDVDVFGQAYLDSVANGSPDPALIAPNLASGVAVIHATGATTTRRGNLRLVATLYRSQRGGLALRGPSLIDPLGLGRALDNPEAEVHLVVRTHGDAQRGDVAAQLSNFLDPYCSDPSFGYFEGENLCADVQFAVFGAGAAGEHPVFGVSAPTSPLPGARAVLTRNGDAIQAVLETRLGE